MKRSIAALLAFVFTMCFFLGGILNVSAFIQINPIDFSPFDFGEEYEFAFADLYSTIALPLMPSQEISAETYIQKDTDVWKNVVPVWDQIEEENKIDVSIQDSPIVLILKPDGSDSSIRFLPQVQYTKHIDGEVKPGDGMTLTQCIVTKVCRNETNEEIKEGQKIWVKEDYFTFTNAQGTMMLYAPEGSDLNPLEYESLVFGNIYNDAKNRFILDINPIHFTVNGPIGKYSEDAPHRAFTNIYSSEERIWDKYGEKVSKCFNIEINPYYCKRSQSVFSVFVSVLLGFGAGVLVCIVPTTIVLIVRRKKSRAASAVPVPPDRD